MRYQVSYRPAAQRQLKRLTAQTQDRIMTAVDGLAENPRPHGSLKLSGTPAFRSPLYRIRIGDYRIVYEIHDRELIVIIVEIPHRGQVYR